MIFYRSARSGAKEAMNDETRQKNRAIVCGTAVACG